MKHTALFEKHKNLGAKFIEFHGWEMPLEYSGVVKEHEAVRTAAGLFDVSHMGAIEVGGEDCMDFLRRVLTFRPETLPVDTARYAFLLNERGGVRDDLMAFRLTDERFLLVVNASNAEADLDWLKTNAKDKTVLIDDSPDTCILALQGPNSWAVAKAVLGIDPAAIKYHGFINSQFEGTGIIISKTGYTGEKGFEIYIHKSAAGRLWDALLEAGRPHGLVPCGLGARDTLRLEMGYLLHGNDIDEDTNPVEAGYEGMVDFENSDFIGRDALMRVKEGGPARTLKGLVVGHGIPRRGNAILAGGTEAGVVTSGNFSPMLKQGIALGYMKAGAPLDDITVDIRGKLHEARVAELPFYRRK